jgi:hypothetical protein
MARQRSHSIEFKRQVAQEFIAGESLYALSKRHDISRPRRVRQATRKKGSPAARSPEMRPAWRRYAPPRRTLAIGAGTLAVGGNDGAGLCDTRFADAATMLAAAFIGLRDDEALVGCGLGAEPAGHRLFWLGLLLLAAALAQPTDEPSDHERGQQERDDHAHADEQIGENDSGAALDGGLQSMPLYGQSSGSPRRFMH